MKMASLFLNLTFQCIIMLLLPAIIVLDSLPAAMSDLAAERSALLSFRSAVGGRTRRWNISGKSPCLWPGVQCNDDTVTALHLPGCALSGKIPVGTIGKLTSLKTLSLRFNYLSGSLPSDLSSCSMLRNLYLYGNRFSGELPESLFTLNQLVRINLAENRFSGNFPIGFNNLTRIKTLYLENNELSGSIPDLALLNLSQFNVSYNRLNGSIPKSLLSMPATAFAGNSLCDGPFKPCPSNPPVLPPAIAPSPFTMTNSTMNINKGLPEGVISAIVVGSILVFILLIALLLFFYRHKKSNQKTSSIDVAAIDHLDREISGRKGIRAERKLVYVGNWEEVFDMKDLLSATAEVLGKGTFGTAYKAVLQRGYTVAVNRLKDVRLSEVEFREKIEVMGAMEHQNLVSVRAYFYSKEEKLLVYDYLPIGSLSALLHCNVGVRRTLSWNKRINIALSSARGIEYIHSQVPQVCHGNIKSSNILLTKSSEACVSDFGFNHLVNTSSTPYPTRRSGYRAPEVTEPHMVSQQADVYSFGVLVLELITGRTPINVVQDEETFFDLPRWVRSIVKEEWRNKIFDRQLRNENVDEEKKIVRLLQLAVECTTQCPNMRPWISEVRQKIEYLQSNRYF